MNILLTLLLTLQVEAPDETDWGQYNHIETLTQRGFQLHINKATKMLVYDVEDSTNPKENFTYFIILNKSHAKDKHWVIIDWEVKYFRRRYILHDSMTPQYTLYSKNNWSINWFDPYHFNRGKQVGRQIFYNIKHVDQFVVPLRKGELFIQPVLGKFIHMSLAEIKQFK